MAHGNPTVPLLSAIIVSLGLLGLFLKSRKKKEPEERQLNAFIEEFEVQPSPNPLPPLAPLSLSGLRFAAKDIFDVEGHVTGFGNPTWKATHETAKSTAPTVAVLLQNGATLVGKTHMDELAYSINGENKHYGTPLNTAAPDHVPGGSSSGSAAAVAAGVVDFALGTDTAGSIRIPAAYNGIYSFRPSHGSVPSAGVVPMSPSLDAVGWLTRDASLLRAVGAVLLPSPPASPKRVQRVILAEDLFALSAAPKEPIIAALTGTLAKLNPSARVERTRIGEFFASKVPALQEFARDGKDGMTGDEALVGIREAMRALQAWEFKQAHGEWVTSAKPDLAADVAARVSAAMSASEEQAKKAAQVRQELRAALDALLTTDTVLVLPPSAGAPPKRSSPPKSLDDLRQRAMQLVAISSLGGLPQVTIPVGTENGKEDGIPLSFSVLGGHGADAMLLDTAVELSMGVTKVAEAFWKRGTQAGPRGAEQRAEEAKNKGNEALKAKRYVEAVKHYNEAIRLDRSNATFFSNKALALMQLGRNGDAEAACTEALNLDPKNVKALLRRGFTREQIGAYDQALEDFQQALVLEPSNVQAKSAIGRMKDMGLTT